MSHNTLEVYFARPEWSNKAAFLDLPCACYGLLSACLVCILLFPVEWIVVCHKSGCWCWGLCQRRVTGCWVKAVQASVVPTNIDRKVTDIHSGCQLHTVNIGQPFSYREINVPEKAPVFLPVDQNLIYFFLLILFMAVG